MLEQLGDRLPQPRDTSPSLLLDAIATARRDEELAALLRERLGRRETVLAGVVAQARAAGELTDEISTEAMTRFCTMLAAGALVLRGIGLESPDSGEWHALVARLLDALTPSGESS